MAKEGLPSIYDYTLDELKGMLKPSFRARKYGVFFSFKCGKRV